MYYIHDTKFSKYEWNINTDVCFKILNVFFYLNKKYWVDEKLKVANFLFSIFNNINTMFILNIFEVNIVSEFYILINDQ